MSHIAGHIDPNPGTSGTGQWLIKYIQMLQKQKPTVPKKASALNIPNALGVAGDAFNMFADARSSNLKRRAMSSEFKLGRQRIGIAREDLRKKRILMNEQLAGRGLMGQTREGMPATIWKTQGQEQRINVAEAQQYSDRRYWKKSEKQQRLRRLVSRFI